MLSFIYSGKGANNELRSELRKTLLDAATQKVNLTRAHERIQSLENELRIIQPGCELLRSSMDSYSVNLIPLPKDLSPDGQKTISALEQHILSLLSDVEQKDAKLSELDRVIDDYRRKLAVCRHRQGLLYRDFQTERQVSQLG